MWRISAGLLWILAVGMGMSTLWSYATTPGRQDEPPRRWPAESRITRASGRATLLLFAHAECPCTRAGLGELALILARTQGLLSAHVVFFQPEAADGGSFETSLSKEAAAIPGVHALRDEGGLEALRFRARTSGQAILYDAHGRLVFTGGITWARGHSGDNSGRSAIISLVTNGTSMTPQAPVYGCSILGAVAAQP